MLEGPLDLALSPITTGMGIYSNLRDIDDSTGVRVAYPIPAYFFALSVSIGGSLIRTATGLIELPVGLLLAATPADMDPIFDAVDDARALYETDSEVFQVRIGLNYTINDY
jgi:hypothetical protein